MKRQLTQFAAILIALLFSRLAQAARVLQVSGEDGDEITISQEAKRPWELGEKICFHRKSVEIACGEIFKTRTKDATVKISHRRDAISQVQAESKTNSYVEIVFGQASVSTKDVVVADPQNAKRMIATSTDPFDHAPPPMLPSDTDKDDSQAGLEAIPRIPASQEVVLLGKEDLMQGSDLLDNDPDHRAIGKGVMSDLSVGVSYIFPTLQYQQMLTNHIATGVLASVLSIPVGNGSLRGYGGLLTINSYGLEPFRGPWFQLGAGLYSLTANTVGVDETYTSAAALTNVGWRFLWSSGINFGVGVGAQYLFNPKPANSSLDFSGLLPSISMDLGFAF